MNVLPVPQAMISLPRSASHESCRAPPPAPCLVRTRVFGPWFAAPGRRPGELIPVTPREVSDIAARGSGSALTVQGILGVLAPLVGGGHDPPRLKGSCRTAVKNESMSALLHVAAGRRTCTGSPYPPSPPWPPGRCRCRASRHALATPTTSHTSLNCSAYSGSVRK